MGETEKKTAAPPEPIEGVRVADSTNSAWTPGSWLYEEHWHGQSRWEQADKFCVCRNAEECCHDLNYTYARAGVRFEVVRFVPETKTVESKSAFCPSCREWFSFAAGATREVEQRHGEAGRYVWRVVDCTRCHRTAVGVTRAEWRSS